MFQGTILFQNLITCTSNSPSVCRLGIMLSLLRWKSIFSYCQKIPFCVAVLKFLSYYSLWLFRRNRQLLRSFNIQAYFANSNNLGSILCTLSNVSRSFVKGEYHSIMTFISVPSFWFRPYFTVELWFL